MMDARFHGHDILVCYSVACCGVIHFLLLNRPGSDGTERSREG
jgi:hypothetical protein